MTIGELQILFRTEYKGDSAAKLINDLDKISSSGSKLTNVMGKVNKAMGGDVFKNASEGFKNRNPHLFNSPQSGAIMQSDRFLSQGAKNLMKMGAFNPGGGHILMSDKFLAEGAKRALSMGSLLGEPPVIPPSKIRSASGSFGGAFGGSLLARAGLGGGAAGIAAALTFKALQMAMSALTKTVKQVTDAFENARHLYASSLQSGAGLNFTARRESLASVIGVSTKDVYQFGQAVLFLSPRLKFATDIMARTTPALTSVAYEFKILQMNLQAMFASLGADAAPALRKFANGLSLIIKLITEFNDKNHAGQFVAGFIQGLFPTIGRIVQSGRDSGNAPPPISFMKQIQASAWERMGLVIGGMGGGNPQVETARNTKQTADGVKQLVRAVGGGRGGNFGYNPFVGQQSYQ